MLQTYFANNQKKMLKVICIICSLIVPTLVLGPFVPDLIISLLALWFLYFTINKKLTFVYQNTYFYFFLGFWIICIFASLLSQDVLFSLRSSLPYFRIGIFALLISFLIDNEEKIIDFFYIAFLITFSLLVIDGYIQFFSGSNLIGLEAGGKRISSFFGNEYILGSFLVRLLPLLIGLFIIRSNKAKWENYFFPIFLALVSGVIFISGGRASLAFLILSLTFLMIFLKGYKITKIFITSFVIFVIAITIATKPRIYERQIIDTINSFGINGPKFYFFSKDHDDLIKTSWKMFLDKPILGHGPKSFRKICSNPKYSVGPHSCGPHPHNFYIQLLAETGLLGFSFLFGLLIFFIFLISKHIWSLFIHKKSTLTNYQICLLAGLLITIWPITTNGNFFNNNLMIVYGLQMGFFRKEMT